MDRKNMKGCTRCVYSATCYLLKVVRDNNEIRTILPYVTRFLVAPYDLAEICQYYLEKEEKT